MNGPGPIIMRPEAVTSLEGEDRWSDGPAVSSCNVSNSNGTNRYPKFIQELNFQAFVVSGEELHYEVVIATLWRGIWEVFSDDNMIGGGEELPQVFVPGGSDVRGV